VSDPKPPAPKAELAADFLFAEKLPEKFGYLVVHMQDAKTVLLA